ncbi:MAG: aldehyde dehydrogenase (NADP(+)), partial [Myxococcota bacterium]
PHGKHLIAGDWVATDEAFSSEPAHGEGYEFSVGTPDLVARAAKAADRCFESYGYSSRADRAAFLNAIADELEARADAITMIGSSETGLPEARLQGERRRTTGQLRLFAEHILAADYLDRRHDKALPEREPLPRPDLKMVQRPVGVVAVFGASNFPLAFSTAGGDTAAALAAGCPVVVRGHPAHPGTGEIVADAILAAIGKCSVDPGVFSLIQGGGNDVGAALVQHPSIKAVGFTGSLAGGRALFDLCAARLEPIPFFGELGSVNPMFLLANAVKSRGAEIGSGWASSLMMGAGQFCTNPGIAVVSIGAAGDEFVEAAQTALSNSDAQTMLTDGIAAAYRAGQERVASISDVRHVLSTNSEGRNALPALYEVTANTWLKIEALREEVFGPLGIIVRTSGTDQMEAIARALQGQLTVTLHMAHGDEDAAKRLMPIVERKAGRILVNGFPTGVEVSNAMIHGGPYPASTNFGATSVGTLSIRRFLRPVCYQAVPDELLPLDLK